MLFSSQSQSLKIHFLHLGVKSLLLLEPTKSDESVFPDGETHQSFDLLNENFHVPAEKTYYNCRMHKIPEFSSKQHLVKVSKSIIFLSIKGLKV